MGVSQPLGLGDKLREAIADAQRTLDSMDLRGKLKIDVVPGDVSSGSGVEASIDRTAKDARDAAEKSIYGPESGQGPLAPSDKLVDALNRLLKTMEGLPDNLDKGSRRRGRRRSGGGGEGEEGEGGYVNPYILQGMIQNPIGTAKSSLWSMLMGGSGTGLKPPGWLMGKLAGSSGELSIGKALGAETLGGASQFLSGGAIAAAGAGAFIAAFGKTMGMQMDAASDRTRDADQYVTDDKFGNNMGFSWRRGAWMDQFQSRRDIWQNDIRETIATANVGMGGLGGAAGDVGVVDAVQKAVNTAFNIGVSNQQMGSVLGAGVRSGTFSMRSGEGELVKYLSLIENWTRTTADHGLSSNEAIQRLAEVAQKGAQGTGGLVTRGAMISLLSMDERARQALPESLGRTGALNGLNALGADPTSDPQRAMMMNQFLGSDGNLTADGRGAAIKALGADQVALMEKHYGRFAGTAIASQLTRTDYGKKLARALSFRQLRGAGVHGAAAALTMGSGDFLGDSEAMEIANNPKFLDDVRGMDRESDRGMRTKDVDDSQERDLARLGQQVQRLSGLTANTAVGLRQLASELTSAKRALVDWADNLRMWQGSHNGYAHGPGR